MTFEILRKQPITFYEKNGIKFFNTFSAADKFKKPLELSWNLKSETPSIVAKSSYNDDKSIYEIKLDNKRTECKGLSIISNPKNKGIGEVLNLASLITFKENMFSDYYIFALRDAIQFYTKYGFNLLSHNINEIIHNLKYVAKNKNERYSDIKNSAEFFIKKLKDPDYKDKSNITILSNNLVSDYMRDMIREGHKINSDDLYSHTHMHFSTIDTVRNRDYINTLLDRHEINYEI